jgi:uroporphyrin-III C-methyltransferase
MVDSSSQELPAKSALPEEPAGRKRAHSYSRLTTAIAVLALATASYSLWRLDAIRDRLDEVNDLARTLAADRNALQGELRTLAQRETQSQRELVARLDAFNALPKQVQDLSTAVEDLQGRTEGPQRAWSRAEALFLIEIAERSLVLDRDVATAIAALESADSRLASVRDPALTAARQQLANDLQALRTTRVPDETGLLTRLVAAEGEVARLPIEGLLAVERDDESREVMPQGLFSRASAIVGRALANLIRVREVDKRGAAVVTLDQQLVRQQHLQLLLLSARTAVARHDRPSYRGALASARQWLGEYFDTTSPSVQALLKEIQLLEAIDIAPPLPDISKSTEALQRLMPRGAA